MSDKNRNLTHTPESPSRRRFVRSGILGAVVAPVALGALTSCDTSQASERAGAAGSGAAAPPPPPTPTAAEKAATMDAKHEAGIKAFPAPTKGKGNVLMQPRMDGSTKVYELTARRIKWETEPGRLVDAFAFNEQVPGPMIRVREGDRVRVVLKNELEESTAIHFHGLELPIDQDGVPFITQPPIKPGETYTYEFTVPVGNHGSHMYHSHYNATTQVGLGMLGAFVVEPRTATAVERADVDYTMILNDGSHGYTVNGKSFPATEPIVAKLGQRVRIRFMNEGMMIHPMHLHGMHMTVIAKDGWMQPAPWKCDTLNVAPGERWDVIVSCDKPGTWAFHCHILSHAETHHGMFGMVTALVVA